MKQFLESEVFVLCFTFIIFFLAQKLQEKLKWILLNPIMVSVAIIILFLTVFNIDYSAYHQGTRMIEFFLKPAVVAMGVPLYLQLERIKKQAVIIVVSQLAGCITGIVSVVLIAKLLGASKEIVLSVAPKSVTVPIAMEVSKMIGGIPALTAAVVLVVGIFGAIFGYTILKLARVTNPISQSLAMGTASHGIGTSRSMAISSTYGVYSSLGLILNGIFTSVLTPYILKLIAI
jgi:predicted murein hydrolase (TIGR00659 family)